MSKSDRNFGLYKWYSNSSTVIISTSMPVKMVNAIEEFKRQVNMKRSEAIVYLIHMGFTYLKLIESQERMNNE